MSQIKQILQKLNSLFSRKSGRTGSDELPPDFMGGNNSNIVPPPFSNDSAPPSFMGSAPVSLSEKTLNFIKKLGSRASTQLQSNSIPHEFTQYVQKNLQPAFLAESATKFIQRRGLGVGGLFATVFLCAFFLSDVTSLILETYLPTPPPPKPVMTFQNRGSFGKNNVDSYAIIWGRNLISSRGLLPGEFKKLGYDEEAPAVRSNLPLNLVGTLVLRDELKSIATIEDKSNNLVIPVRVQDEIPSKLKVLKIESSRVEFVNLSSNRKEYIDLPDTESTAPKIQIGSQTKVSGNSLVEQVAPNEYSIARSEIEKLTSGNNLAEILTQARAVPNIENGITTGYRLYQIVPGSIFDKLGLRDGDLICGANGAPVDDLNKVMELMSSLKTINKLGLCLKREGKQSDYTYNIK